MPASLIALAPEPINVERLREISLFGALSDEVLSKLASKLKQVNVGPGDVIFSEGEPASEMFVVLEGEVEVMKKSRKGRLHRVAILGPLDTIGEMSVIDVQARAGTARSLAPTRLLRLSTGDLDELYRVDLKAYALVVLNIARELARRLRMTDGILADFAANMLDDYLERGRGHRP